MSGDGEVGVKKTPPTTVKPMGTHFCNICQTSTNGTDCSDHKSTEGYELLKHTEIFPPIEEMTQPADFKDVTGGYQSQRL